MKKLWSILFLIGASLLLYLYVKVQPSDTPEDTPSDRAGSQKIAPTADLKKATEPNPYDTPDPEDPRLTRIADGRVHYNPSIETSRSLATTLDPQEAIDTITQLISHYRYAYQENPVGVENFEFTEQLLGKNPKRIVFVDPKSSALKNNELVDSWNTPYFFHPVSAQELEVRSAGPDRQLWTKDDILSANSTP